MLGPVKPTGAKVIPDNKEAAKLGWLDWWFRWWGQPFVANVRGKGKTRSLFMGYELVSRLPEVSLRVLLSQKGCRAAATPFKWWFLGGCFVPISCETLLILAVRIIQLDPTCFHHVQ